MTRRRPYLAAVLLVGLCLVPGAIAAPSAARAAEDDLRLEATTTYVLDPPSGAVHVEIDVRATNLRPDRETATGIIRYFYRQVFFAIHPESTRIRATDSEVPLRVTTQARESFIQARVHLADTLDYRETVRLRVTYDLPGGAPRSESDIRVGVAFATFYAWAHGDDELSTVRVVLPRPFEDQVEGAVTVRTERGARTIHQARAIADVARWYVVVVAHREAALTADTVPLPDRQVVVHAWPEDERWRSRVSDVLARGMPELEDLVGLPWPVTGALDVVEVHTPLLEGYAGVFYTDERRIEISEDLDDLTILHEASHAWFDSSLFQERWIYEGLADEFASRALRALGPVEAPPAGVRPDAQAAVRLNDWGYPGRLDDEDSEAREIYGYNAAWTVMRQLVADVGVRPMQEVLRAADRDETAYRGDRPPEPAPSERDDWRRFLDLLEQVGGADDAEAVFRRWIVNDDEAALLDDRADARRHYAELVGRAAGWSIPIYVRSQMERWQFDEARDRIEEAEAILATRDRIALAATEQGLNVPAGLEQAWERANLNLVMAEDVADSQLGALRELTEASVALAVPSDPIVALGLAGGASPDATIAAARMAFERGDPRAAVALADATVSMVEAGADAGRMRLIALGGGGLAATLAFVMYGAARMRRRRAIGIAAPPATVTPYPTAAGPVAGEATEDTIEP